MHIRAVRWSIVARIRAGENIDDLAKELQTTPESLRRLENSMRGWTASPDTFALKNSVCTLSDIGKSPADIAKELGCPLSFVYRTLRKFRPNRDHASRIARSRYSVAAQQKIDKIIRLTNEGWRQIEVAKELGVTRQYISQVLSRQRVTRYEDTSMLITPELIKQMQQDLRDHRFEDLDQLKLTDTEAMSLRVAITPENVTFQHKGADLAATTLEDARNMVRSATGA